VVQEVLKLFNSTYTTTNRATEERKTLDNLLLLLAYAYNFKVVGSQLVYDVLGRLAKSFLAKDLELMLLMLKNSGFTLRKDDPAQMKVFITTVQVRNVGTFVVADFHHNV
jgi:nucleolar MIF4G domain-containing protein 1